jgi:hypothetical protein
MFQVLLVGLTLHARDPQGRSVRSLVSYCRLVKHKAERAFLGG